jgi:hypothetical protein
MNHFIHEEEEGRKDWWSVALRVCIRSWLMMSVGVLSLTLLHITFLYYIINHPVITGYNQKPHNH